MKKRGYIIGASSVSAGMLSIILMFFSFLRRSTSTAASSRFTYYNSFEVINFNGVWSIKLVSVLQIVLIVFAVAAIVIGTLKLLEVSLDKDYGLDESVLIALSILAFIGICLIFFAVLYCKFSNRIADTDAYNIRYRVFVAPFLQVVFTIAAYAVSSIMSAKNNKEELEALSDEPLVETEGEAEQNEEGENILIDETSQASTNENPEKDNVKKEDEQDKKQVVVSAAVIRCGEEILCMQRNAAKYDYISYKYEFPGGKIEAGESEEDAIIRELREEMDLSVTIEGKFTTIKHDYPDFCLTMNVFNCRVESKDFNLKEHKSFCWKTLDGLAELDWAEADKKVVEQLLK